MTKNGLISNNLWNILISNYTAVNILLFEAQWKIIFLPFFLLIIPTLHMVTVMLLSTRFYFILNPLAHKYHCSMAVLSGIGWVVILHLVCNAAWEIHKMVTKNNDWVSSHRLTLLSCVSFFMCTLFTIIPFMFLNSYSSILLSCTATDMVLHFVIMQSRLWSQDIF